MRITVLGKSPSWPDAGAACSGYLVEHDGFSLLLDCGSGVFSKLRARRDYTDLDAVLLTHLHSDHFLDLIPFSYALTLSPRRREQRPALHAPPGAAETFRRVAGAWGPEELVESGFELREYDPSTPLDLGPLHVRFCAVPHFTETFAVELLAGGARFTFGADCAPNATLVEFARDTDLLLVEATLTEPEESEDRGHMTAREAGELGRQAGARRFVLTHFSDELDPERLRADAAGGFGAPVELAAEGAEYSLEP